MAVEYRFMATAAPFVKLLRQLSNAKDEYRSGALDVSWDGGKASLFLVFGQPNHATFEGDDGVELQGQEALAALLHRLPRKFTVSPWRKAVSRDETLKMSLEELMEPFAQLAGQASPDDPSPSGATDVGEGSGFVPDFDFGLEDFPLLPLGQSMWSDAAVNVVHLDLLIPKLPTSLIVLNGPKLRAAAVLINGQLVDAVWVDDQERAAGEGAAMALMGAREGTVSGYRVDDNRLAEALTMLWRCPSVYRDINIGWIDPDRFLASLQNERRDCVLRIEGPERAVAFIVAGEFIASYTQSQRESVASTDAIRELLASGRGTLTILQRAGDSPLGKSVVEDQAPTTGVHPIPVPAGLADGSGDHAETAAILPLPYASVDYPAVAVESDPWGGLPPAPDVETELNGEPGQTTQWATLDTAEAVAPDAADIPVHEGFQHFAAEEDLTHYTPPADGEAEAAVVTPLQDDGTPAGDWAPASHEEIPYAAIDPDPGVTPVPVDHDGAADATGWSAPLEHDANNAAPEAGEWFAAGAVPDPDSAEAPVVPVPVTAEHAWTPAQPAWAPVAEEAAAPGGVFYGEPDAAGSGFSQPGDDSPPAIADGLDFEAIKADLIQIGVLWLGNDDVAPVADLIRNTRASVDDFVSTIESIKGISVVGHDPSVIRAMAREMHYHAAEYLSGV